MLLTVIPAKNEANSLGKVITNLPINGLLQLIIPVLNGCTDNSLDTLRQINCPLLAPLCFDEPLGIDIPRAIGAIEAKQLDAKGVLFIDGDMHRVNSKILTNLILAVQENRLDLALTDCYPSHASQNISPTAMHLLNIRKKLNWHLNLFEKIKSATPSHGPHAISGRLLRLADPTDFAVPPLLLAKAAKAGLRIGVAAQTTHLQLGSPLRSPTHSSKIMETIIGDCLAALHIQNGKPVNRVMNGREYIGYHTERRWDLLEAFSKGNTNTYCFKT